MTTVSWAQESTHRGWVFFEVIRWQMIGGSSLDNKYFAFMSLFSQLFKNTGGEDLLLPWSCVGYALYVQFLYSDWSKCDRWVHAETLCSILKLVYFESTCAVLTVFFHWMVQNGIKLLSRVFCYSWLVCLLGFWFGNVSLDKVGNPISDGIAFVFHLAWCVRRKRL